MVSMKRSKVKDELTPTRPTSLMKSINPLVPQVYYVSTLTQTSGHTEERTEGFTSHKPGIKSSHHLSGRPQSQRKPLVVEAETLY